MLIQKNKISEINNENVMLKAENDQIINDLLEYAKIQGNKMRKKMKKLK